MAVTRTIDQDTTTVVSGESDVDVYADCPRVWCTSSDGPARSLDGFCEHCGARDHDCL